MKKHSVLICTTLAAGWVLFSCTKKPDVAPVADTEVKTSIDAAYATQLVSDVEMICSFIGEDHSTGYQKFYGPVPASLSSFSIIRAGNRISINYNNTMCRDGKVRDGSIWLFFKEAEYATHPITGNENYIRDYNFTGRITLEEYKVDGWLIDNKDYENPNSGTNNTTVLITNLRADSKTPVSGNLQWTLSGGFTMRKNADSMAWKGTITKTLDNTGDTKVFAANAQSAIDWSMAKISYRGEAKGYTPGNVPYTIKYSDKAPLRRDFSCFPDKVKDVNNGTTLSPNFREFHPITSGIAYFTTGNAYPREIYFDNTQITYGGDLSPIDLPAQCDNKAAVQIKGIFYPIDLKD